MLLCAFSFVPANFAFILDCTYVDKLFWFIPMAYSCVGRLLEIGDPRKIEAVTQNHLPGRNNSDVKALNFYRVPVKLLPTNLGQFFPNLEGYECHMGGLTELSIENFQDLPNLRSVWIPFNSFSEMPDVFRHNLKLEGINFNANAIRHVSAQAFSNLSNLRWLEFVDSGCINRKVENNRAEVVNLIAHLGSSCPPSSRMIQDELLASEKFQRIVDQQIAERMNPLTLKVSEHENRIELLEKLLFESIRGRKNSYQ
jgi:hypothetical protein